MAELRKETSQEMGLHEEQLKEELRKNSSLLTKVKI